MGSVLKNLGHSHIKLQKTPLGEKIIVFASRPGLIVGKKGQNIKKLTEDLKEKFKLENPQIEINEIDRPELDAQIVAERVASSLEKFGTQRFKGIGHKIMADVMGAGAMGIEILISGKIPSSRAKRWRFYQGYLKKCGDIAIVGVRKAYAAAQLKTGTIGVQVRIMPPDLKLPDKIVMLEAAEISEEMKKQIETAEKKVEKQEPAAEEKKARKPAKKKEAETAEKPAEKAAEKPVEKAAEKPVKPRKKKPESSEPQEQKKEAPAAENPEQEKTE
ncbi:30S ribosomal protein S3 [archaeon]|nr:30S ribosomal protein S3 [archaeon]